MTDRDYEYAVDVVKLNKSFGGRRVVQELSLQVRPGEIFGFLGPNGSGKTTAIRMMCGLLTPDSGRGRCLGYDILAERDHIRRRIGYMTQKFSYWDDLTIRENLDFVARIHGLRPRRQVVERALDTLNLSGRAGQLTGSLSGGWKQRLALAAALLPKPRLLMLDEPTAGVDPQARRDFWEELHRLAAEGLAILVSTHYMDEAERCHKLACLARGRLLVQGSADQIVQGQKLITWSISGPDVYSLAAVLEKRAEVEQTVIFGQALHVSSLNGPGLARAIKETLAAFAASGRSYKAREAPSTLEDAFIYLMGRAEMVSQKPEGF